MSTANHLSTLDLAAMLDTDQSATDPAIKKLLERKKTRSTQKKSQPWKETYSIAPDDVPHTTSIHDKPYWWNQDDPSESSMGA